MQVKTVVEAVRDTLRAEMRRDDRIILMGEDVGQTGGVFRATQDLLEEFGPERVIDTPLAELSIVGIAIGAAAVGLLPIAEIQFADFIYPAFDHIVNEAAKLRFRSNGAFGCPLVIRTPYGGGIHGAIYHSQSIEAFFTHVPGLKVLAPSTPADAAGLLRAAIRDPDPVLFLEHKKTYRTIRGEVPDDGALTPIGRAEVRRAGEDVTLLAYGYMLHECLRAAEELEREEIDAEVIDLRSLNPLDSETVLNSVRKTSKVCIVHEDTRTMGFGAELAAMMAEEALLDLDAPVMRVTGPDVAGIPFNDAGEEEFLPNAEKIANAVRKLARY